MNIAAEQSLARFLEAPTRFLFFTGKGGVGKTSLACASAIALADGGSACCWSAPTRPRIWMKCWECDLTSDADGDCRRAATGRVEH